MFLFDHGDFFTQFMDSAAGKYKFVFKITDTLFLDTGGVLFRVEWCIRHLWPSSIIISFKVTSIAYDQYTDYPFLNIRTYSYTDELRREAREVVLPRIQSLLQGALAYSTLSIDRHRERLG